MRRLILGVFLMGRMNNIRIYLSPLFLANRMEQGLS